ncbi:phage portal protein [Bacillus anthracis]|uniref:phage portal protein n=1 Tax=Bacillus anthracis TaxID=1392 RepID=UPI000D392BBA|nr:phage portal protein [Bacillus anthracis]PTR54786.1 phage portal protein [Bacillus anthracis]
MGLFSGLFSKKPVLEERSTYDSMEVDGAFSLDSLLVTDAVTEEKVLKIPTARSCVELITSSIAQMPVYLYKENADGSVERILDDNRVHLLNHEANDFLNGYSLKKHMVKDYLLHGSSYVSIIEAGNTILELHPLLSKAIVVNKRIKHGYRTVGADIFLSNSENGAVNELNRQQTKFKPHELMITLQDTNDGLTSHGVIKHGQDIFKQALSESVYTHNLYENGALPSGLLKTDARLNKKQASSLREAWQKLYGGVKNAAKTVVLQEGMKYEALSMNPSEIQMSETRKATNSEICKLFGVPESMVNATIGKQYVSLEQNQLYLLKNTLSPIIVAMESSMDKALLLESEKDKGYFFRFDTSELIRSTEKELVDTVVTAVQGGIFTINEGRAKFNLPSIDEGDNVLVTPGASQMGDKNTKETTDPHEEEQLNDKTGTQTD